MAKELIYSIRAPNGKVYEVRGPEGASQPQLVRALLAKHPEAAQPAAPAAPAAAEEPKDKEASLIGSLAKGVLGTASDIRTTLGSIFGDENEAVREGLARQEELERQYGRSAGLSAIADAYTRGGFGSALGSALSGAPKIVAEMYPYAAIMGGGALAATGLGAGPGLALLASGAAALPLTYAQNIQRQAAEDIRAGRQVELDKGSALLAGVGSAALDVVGGRFALGKNAVAKLLGKKPGTSASALATQEAEEALARKALEAKARMSYPGMAVRGAASEVPTEVVQQVLERMQAGLPLTTPDAFEEYGEAAYGGMVGGSTLGMLGRVGERNEARMKLGMIPGAVPTAEGAPPQAEAVVLRELPLPKEIEALSPQERIKLLEDAKRGDIPDTPVNRLTLKKLESLVAQDLRKLPGAPELKTQLELEGVELPPGLEDVLAKENKTREAAKAAEIAALQTARGPVLGPVAEAGPAKPAPQQGAFAFEEAAPEGRVPGVVNPNFVVTPEFIGQLGVPFPRVKLPNGEETVDAPRVRRLLNRVAGKSLGEIASATKPGDLKRPGFEGLILQRLLQPTVAAPQTSPPAAVPVSEPTQGALDLGAPATPAPPPKLPTPAEIDTMSLEDLLTLQQALPTISLPDSGMLPTIEAKLNDAIAKAQEVRQAEEQAAAEEDRQKVVKGQKAFPFMRLSASEREWLEERERQQPSTPDVQEPASEIEEGPSPQGELAFEPPAPAEPTPAEPTPKASTLPTPEQIDAMPLEEKLALRASLPDLIIPDPGIRQTLQDKLDESIAAAQEAADAEARAEAERAAAEDRKKVVKGQKPFSSMRISATERAWLEERQRRLEEARAEEFQKPASEKEEVAPTQGELDFEAALPPSPPPATGPSGETATPAPPPYADRDVPTFKMAGNQTATIPKGDDGKYTVSVRNDKGEETYRSEPFASAKEARAHVTQLKKQATNAQKAEKAASKKQPETKPETGLAAPEEGAGKAAPEAGTTAPKKRERKPRPTKKAAQPKSEPKSEPKSKPEAGTTAPEAGTTAPEKGAGKAEPKKSDAETAWENASAKNDPAWKDLIPEHKELWAQTVANSDPKWEEIHSFIKMRHRNNKVADITRDLTEQGREAAQQKRKEQEKRASKRGSTTPKADRDVERILLDAADEGTITPATQGKSPQERAEEEENAARQRREEADRLAREAEEARAAARKAREDAEAAEAARKAEEAAKQAAEAARQAEEEARKQQEAADAAAEAERKKLDEEAQAVADYAANSFYNGKVAWREGPYALVRGVSDRGKILYVPIKHTSGAQYAFFRIDVDGVNPTADFTSEVLQKMRDVKARLEQEAADKHATSPYIKFKDGFAASESVSEEIGAIAREWKSILKLDVPIYLTTEADAQKNIDKFTGPHRIIGRKEISSTELGSTQRMSDGSRYIIFKDKQSLFSNLSVLAHELGHIHMAHVYENAPPHIKDELRKAHDAWLIKQKGKTAAEFVLAMRGRAGKSLARTADPTLLAKDMQSFIRYWSSFEEWYADQTAHWAMSSAEPVGVVEKFFKRLGQQIRQFYQRLKNAKYLPDETFMRYMDYVRYAGTGNNAASFGATDDAPSFAMAPSGTPVTSVPISPAAQAVINAMPAAIQSQATSFINGVLPAPGGLRANLSNWVISARQEITDRDAPVALKLAAKYTKAMHDAEGNVSPELARRQAAAADYLVVQYFRDGTAEFNPKTGTYKTGGTEFDPKTKQYKRVKSEDVVSVEDLLGTHVQGWAKKHNKSFREGMDHLGGIYEAVRLRGLKRAKAPVVSHLDDAEIAKRTKEFDSDPEIRKIFDIMRKQRHDAIDLMVQSGRITKDMADEWKKYSEYIPFDRESDPDEVEDAFRAARRTRSGLAALGSVERDLVGSKRRPVRNTIENHVNLLRWMLTQSIKTTALTSNLRALEKLGQAEVTKNPDYQSNMVVKTYVNGEMVPYRLKSVSDIPAFMVQESPMGGMLKIAQNFSRLLRAGVTALPMFGTSQVVQDIQRAALQSGINDVAGATASALNHFARMAGTGLVGKRHLIQDYYGARAIYGDIDYSQPDPLGALYEDLGLKQRTFLKSSKLGTILHRMEAVSRASDLAVRAAIYETTLRETGNEALAEHRAREIINFRRRGANQGILRLAIHTIPFFNSYLQGMDVTLRSMHGADAPSGLARSHARAYMARQMSIYGLMVALYVMAMRDDDEYLNMKQEERDKKWVLGRIGEGEGIPVSLPVPSEFGVLLKAPIERGMLHIMNLDPMNRTAAEAIKLYFRDTAAELFGRTVPIPQVAKPLFEAWTNISFLTGRNLEGNYQQTLDKLQRTNEQTSEWAKLVAQTAYDATGGAVSVSPIQVDHLLRGYFGTVAAISTGMADMLMEPDRIDKPLNKWAAMGAFTYDPTATQADDEFYAIREKVIQAHNTLNSLQINDPTKAEAYVERNVEKLSAYKTFMHHTQQLSKLRKAIRWLDSPAARAEMPEKERDALREEYKQYARDLRGSLMEFIKEAGLRENLREPN